MTMAGVAWRLARSAVVAARRARDVLGDRRYCRSVGALGRATPGPVTARFLGRVSVRDEMEGFLGQAHWAEDVPGSLPSWLRDARDFLAPQAEADVALLDTLQLPLPPPRGAWAWRPQVRAVLALAPTLDEQLSRICSKGVRHGLEHAGRETWTVAVRRAEADLDTFYDRLFLPLIAARHGAHAHVIDREALRSRWRRTGTLLFLEDSGRPLAGLLAYTSRAEPGTLFYWRNGMTAEAAEDPGLRARLFAALERAIIAQALAHGFTHLDLGLAPALFDDPLFRHKRLLGCSFARAPEAPRLFVAPRPGSTRAVVGALPLLLEEGATGFAAHVAVDADGTPASLRPVRTAVRDACFPGLAHLTLHAPAALAASAPFRTALDELEREVGTPLRLAAPE